jgi:prepilin-type N-terminal cleavage/methylation domain-containing protein
MSRAYPQHSRASGFSLVEVLVASAILGIVMVVLLSTLTTSLTLWRNTEKKMGADREGRAADLLLAQDLSSIVMTANTNFWPRVQTNNGIVSLQFLVLKPSDYQSSGQNNVGDVCFVEYGVREADNVLLRNFVGSGRTYTDILQGGGFPAAFDTARAQVLATNLVPGNRDAVGATGWANEVGTNYFVLLGNNLMPRPSGAATAPAAIEVTMAFVDPDAVANKDLWASSKEQLRHAGLYSFRLALPRVTPATP